MSLSQVQIIRSLAEALAWFEKKLGWGVSPGSLTHLTGRIGELYTAMITRGQMALKVNQRGYDVVGADGERISVKTCTTSTHLKFNRSTIHEVDRVVILRINIDEEEATIEEVVDAPVCAFISTCKELPDGYRYAVSGKSTTPVRLDNLMVSARAETGNRSILQYENGTIVVEENGKRIPIAKAHPPRARCQRRRLPPERQRQQEEHTTARRRHHRRPECLSGPPATPHPASDHPPRQIESDMAPQGGLVRNAAPALRTDLPVHATRAPGSCDVSKHPSIVSSYHGASRMPLATDVSIRGTDGIWRVLDVVLAIRIKEKKPMRCVQCGGHVKLHDAAQDRSQAAHVEDARRWEGCPRSDAYDGGAVRPHPNRVPD